MKNQGVTDERLQLLCGVTGAFRPGVLTALVGISGAGKLSNFYIVVCSIWRDAIYSCVLLMFLLSLWLHTRNHLIANLNVVCNYAGKTTLMDVLAGRKTGGYIEGDIRISGFPKVQETFARIAGYCEQNDIHSPQVTVKESLVYSAWLRLPQETDILVRQVMSICETNSNTAHEHSFAELCTALYFLYLWPLRFSCDSSTAVFLTSKAFVSAFLCVYFLRWVGKHVPNISIFWPRLLWGPCLPALGLHCFGFPGYLNIRLIKKICACWFLMT